MFLLIADEMFGTSHYASTLDALDGLRKHNAGKNWIGTDRGINDVMRAQSNMGI